MTVSQNQCAGALLETSARNAQRFLNALRAFASRAEMATTFGVSLNQIARWQKGGRPDPIDAERLLAIDVCVSLLEGFFEPESIPTWLHGHNAHLDNRRPIDVLIRGRLSEVIRVIEAEKSGAFA